MSWRAAGRALLVAAVMAALLATPVPASAALACDQLTNRELAGQAEVVFVGRVVALVEDHDSVMAPPPLVRPVLRYWPRFIPVPMVRSPAPGPGVPAARFQVTTAYKGPVTTTMTVRVLGTQRRFSAGDTWTVFADRSHGYLFTTECSGNARGQIRAADYGLTGRPPDPAAAPDGPPAEIFWALGILAGLALLAAAGLAVGLALPPAGGGRGDGQQTG